MKRGGLALMVAALLLVPAAPSAADTLNATNTTELINAVSLSNNNLESDTINVAAGTYNLTGPLVIQGENLTIQGDAANTTIIRQTGPSRVIDINNSNSDVDLFDLTITGGNIAGNGGGIVNELGSGDLRVERSAVEGNQATTGGANDGGGGIYNEGGLLTVVDSSVSNNSTSVVGGGSGGGGVWSTSGAIVENSTLSGNSMSASGFPAISGGGAYYTQNGGGRLTHVTIAGNSAAASGGGAFNAGANVALENSILAGNSAADGTNCAPAGAFAPGGVNLEDADTCGLGAAELRNTDARLGPLQDNGGTTRTRALQPGSPAIDAADDTVCGTVPQDQRGRGRTNDGCDIGAFEFEGAAVAAVPDCSPTGTIPLTVSAAPGQDVEGLNYRVDGGPQQFADTPGGSQNSTALDFAEGRRILEYWGQFDNGDEGRHHVTQVLVDKTDPSVAIASEQRRSIYVITRRASVDVTAADALSGLVGDPSADGERIGTRTRGAQTLTKTATDLCGNLQSASLDYRVLGPGLGVRAVLERMRGRVRIRRPGSASAAQKGRPFVPLSQPREIPIRSLVDTRRGSLRLTSSRSRRATSIQDGVISAGLFQVLQSRRRASKGLTELRLKGSSFRRCRAGNRGKGAQGAISRRRIRRLRANVKGRFRTRGRFSAATVRGTDFTVVDRCDGTLTKVTRGRVAVRDFRRKKTVIVRAGKSYLARAPARR